REEHHDQKCVRHPKRPDRLRNDEERHGHRQTREEDEPEGGERPVEVVSGDSYFRRLPAGEVSEYRAGYGVAMFALCQRLESRLYHTPLELERGAPIDGPFKRNKEA